MTDWQDGVTNRLTILEQQINVIHAQLTQLANVLTNQHVPLQYGTESS
jgi:hypothetical protein